MYKRKFKYKFEGKIGDEVILPEFFVRLDARPCYPYMGVGSEDGGQLEYVPSDITITSLELKSEDENDFNEKINKIDSCVLKLYNDEGELLEYWKIHDITKKRREYFYMREDSEEVEVTWSLHYNKCDYFVSDFYSKLLLSDDLTLNEQLTKKSIKKPDQVFQKMLEDLWQRENVKSNQGM